MQKKEDIAFATEAEKKQREDQARFYQSVQTLDIVEVQNLHHQIITDACAIETSIQAFKIKFDKSPNLSKDEINSFLENITFSYKKILAVAKFTTKENFLSVNRSIRGDIVAFLSNYLSKIYKFHANNKLKVIISNPYNIFFETTFKPIELIMLIDNLLSNSQKKNAKNVIINFTAFDNGIKISFMDDGDGLDKQINNPETIFERGFTTTRSSGIGLSHVRQIMNTEFNGEISVNNKTNSGLEFILTFNKK